MYRQIQELRVCSTTLHQAQLLDPITAGIVKAAIKRLKTNTALGVDLFEVSYLNQLCDEALHCGAFERHRAGRRLAYPALRQRHHQLIP